MLLNDKHVLVFAATGAIGSVVAQKFASEGAHVWLSGRNEPALKELLAGIERADGKGSMHIVDATDAQAVEAYVNEVAQTAGRVDAVFNAIGLPPAAFGIPAPSTTQEVELFLKPLHVILASTFLTSRAVAAQMQQQKSGSIVTLSATLSAMTAGAMAGISATYGAIEALTRSLAGEFGPAGVRVNCVRADAMPETRTIQETFAAQARLFGITMEDLLTFHNPLRRPISIAETAATAAFLASDASSGITAQVINVSAGGFV